MSALVSMRAQDYFQKVSFQRRKQMEVPVMLTPITLDGRFMFKSKMTDKASWSLLLLYCLIYVRAFSDLFTFLTVRKAEVTSSCKSSITAFWWKRVVPCQPHEFPPSGSLSNPSAKS